ncbi:hypothetical protein LCGC14_2847890, partial [marine sediment metagenome]
DARKAHDSLTEDYYKNGLMSKEDFDHYHGEIWDGLGRDKIAAGYLTVPEPPRDLEAEIDQLRAANFDTTLTGFNDADLENINKSLKGNIDEISEESLGIKNECPKCGYEW